MGDGVRTSAPSACHEEELLFITTAPTSIYRGGGGKLAGAQVTER